MSRKKIIKKTRSKIIKLNEEILVNWEEKLQNSNKK